MVLRGPARKGGGDCFYGRRLTGSARVRTTLLAPSVVAIKAGRETRRRMTQSRSRKGSGELRGSRDGSRLEPDPFRVRPSM